MTQLIETWKALDLRRRVILFGAVALTFLAVFSLAQIATRPGMALLYSGLDPAAAGEVVGALEQMNVKAEIRGDAIFVPEDARDRVRLSLAGQGLPRQGQAGYELLDGLSGFSATSDMFNAAYWRAKEGELARTILAASGVRAARVHIAVPTRRPFARDKAPTTASVTVTMAGGTLTSDQALAIRYMTALAVAGLDPKQVAVIDSRAGMILAPGSENQAASAASAANEREVKLKSEIEELLAARVGRDRARVSVSVETHRESETLTERIINPDTRVTISSETSEVSESSKGSSGNVTVASNLPDGDANANNNNESSRTETRERVNNDFSQTERTTVRQAGAIRKISVAVLVDGIVTQDANGDPVWNARTPEELEALRQLVIAAIGYDEERGDRVTVDSLAFQPDATPGELVEVGPFQRFIERNAMTLIQLGFLAVVALVLAMTVIRPLLRARSANEELPPGLEALNEGTAQNALAAPGEGEAGLPGMGAGMADGMTGELGGLGELPDLPDLDIEPVEIAPTEILRSAVAERPEETIAMLREWLETEDEREELAA